MIKFWLSDNDINNEIKVKIMRLRYKILRSNLIINNDN